jgi:peptidoglycan L-alanyl-D-glutamate endopeptidase CwlK
MTLREKQSVFALNFYRWGIFAYENGYETTLGEAYRTKSMQLLYFMGYKLMVICGSLKLVKTKHLSRTMKSKHLLKLAHDVFIFKDGKYLTSKEDCQILGDYWETLHINNKWGGNFKSFLDVPHFQMS